MPTVSENRRIWDQYDWPDQGDAWSFQFGGTPALWSFALYPRIHRFLPTSSVLEIAPGYGRWTQFLQRLCQSLIAVDLSEKCIEHCQARFAACRHARFYANDGSSLAVVPDDSIDFAFSFDSLVHAEKDVVQSYIRQLAAKLKPNGVGFIHHSNMGAYQGRLAMLGYHRRLPAAVRSNIFTEKQLERFLSINFGGLRAASMTAALFRDYCVQAGLRCISQELVNWVSGECLIDCFSVLTRPGSQWDRKFVRVENNKFVESAILTGRLALLYAP